MIRFFNGHPQSIFYSQHSDGKAYAWSAIRKNGLRPIVYSAGGSHANYPTMRVLFIIPLARAELPSQLRSGKQSYGVPFNLLSDTTDAGPYWDVTMNYNGFWYSSSAGFVAATGTSVTSNYLDYIGKVRAVSSSASHLRSSSFAVQWGDEEYPEDDERQRYRRPPCARCSRTPE
jgi:hypothetical protein